MTLLKRFETLATGSDLSSHFQAIRVKITILSTTMLTVLLIVIGYSTIQLTRNTILNNQPPELASFESRHGLREEIRQFNSVIELRNIERIEKAILASNAILVVVLAAVTWFALYFFLKPISETYREKEEFLKHASHDLRTPLAIIKSDLQLSLHDSDIATIKETNKSALEEIDRLHLLASGFLKDLSGTKTKDINGHTNVKTLISGVWDSLRSISTRQIMLDLQGSDYVISGNKDAFYQTFYNVLDNCIKYSKTGSTIEVQLSSSDKIIEIKNTTENMDYKPGTGIEIIQKNISSIGAKVQLSSKNNVFRVIIKNL